MQAIRAIVDTYVRLRNEDALLASKQQRLRVLALCDAGNPMFEKLRSQCLEEIAEIEAGLERLRPAPLPPDPPPSLPEVKEEARNPALPDPPSNPPQFLTAVSPSLLASTILAGSISSRLQASEAKPEAELMRLQIALEQRMRSQG